MAQRRLWAIAATIPRRSWLPTRTTPEGADGLPPPADAVKMAALVSNPLFVGLRRDEMEFVAPEGRGGLGGIGGALQHIQWK